MFKFFKRMMPALLIMLLSACGSGNINEASSTDSKVIYSSQDFSLKGLSAKDYFSIMGYNPDKAIAACPNEKIWPNDPSDPLPQKPIPDCGPTLPGHMNTQLAYACDVKNHSMGMQLARSVVGIYTRVKNANSIYILSCTGTIIDRRWILTAAHCIDNEKHPGGWSYEQYVVPWQDNLDGVPDLIHNLNKPLSIGKYEKVRTAYIIDKTPPAGYWHKNYDIGLLELDEDLPDITVNGIPHWFKAIPFAQNDPHKITNHLKLWQAGYGQDEDQKQSGCDENGVDEENCRLKYKDVYVHLNANEEPYHDTIRTAGSIPIDYKGTPSAWQTSGGGDSGGPLLEYNDITQNYSILGVASATPCNLWSGYFAPINDVLTYFVPINHEYIENAIPKIMNGTIPRAEIKCLSGDKNACGMGNVYVVNMGSNNISVNSFNTKSTVVKELNLAATGFYPRKIVFDKYGWYAYVISNNVSNGVISTYKVSEKQLIPLEPKRDIITGHKNPIDIASFNNYVYVLNQNSYELDIYTQTEFGRLIKLDNSIRLDSTLGHPVAIRFESANMPRKANYVYVLYNNAIVKYQLINYEDVLEVPASRYMIPGAYKLQISNYNGETVVQVLSKTSSGNKLTQFYSNSTHGDLRFSLAFDLTADATDIVASIDDTTYMSFISLSNQYIFYNISITNVAEISDLFRAGTPISALGMLDGFLIAASTIDGDNIAIYDAIGDQLLGPINTFKSRGYNPVQIATLDTHQ